MNGNGYLPPISNYQNEYNENNQTIKNQNIQTNMRTLSASNGNNQYSIVANTLNQNYALANEMKELKQLLRNNLHNQNDIQQKIIDYNRIISQQENIIRMNNKKISEHDDKISNILLSFNNYLKIQEKANSIINDCQRKIENNLVPLSSYNNLTSQIQANNNTSNENFKKIFRFNDDTNILLDDIRKQINFNKDVFDRKIAQIKEEEENFFVVKHQENLKFFKENNDGISAQMTQVLNNMNSLEQKFEEETKNVDKNNEKLYEKIELRFKEQENKFQTSDKNLLETEKNLINMHKEYMTIFNELISKQKMALETEIKTIRNLITIAIENIKSEYKEDIEEIKNSFAILKNSVDENKVFFDEFQSYARETLERLTGEQGEHNEQLKVHSSSIVKLEDGAIKFNENIFKQFNDKFNSFSDSTQKKINELETNMSDLINDKYTQNSKDIEDLSEKFESLRKLVDNENKLFNNSPSNLRSLNDKLNETNKNFEEKLISLKNEISKNIEKISISKEDEKKKILESLKKNFENYSEQINDKLDKKMEILERDIREKIEEKENIKDGQVQQYVLESENRIEQKFGQKED